MPSDDVPTIEDKFLEATIAETIAPYIGILPDSVIDQMREDLTMMLLTHPTVSRTYARAVPRGERDYSDTVSKQPSSVSDDEDDDRKAGQTS